MKCQSKEQVMCVLKKAGPLVLYFQPFRGLRGARLNEHRNGQEYYKGIKTMKPIKTLKNFENSLVLIFFSINHV